MVATIRELDEFRDFAASRIESGRELTLVDLMIAWARETERHEAIEALREGLADVDAGRYRPADEFFDELQAKLANK